MNVLGLFHLLKQHNIALSACLYRRVTSTYLLVDPLVIPNMTQATLSSIYEDYVAPRAVDGRPDLLNLIGEDSCTHTAVGQSSAWLRIDLRTEYSVYQVTTWYRNDRESNYRILSISDSCVLLEMKNRR